MEGESSTKGRKARIAGEDILAANGELAEVYEKISTKFTIDPKVTQIGSTIYAVKPGDGSREQQPPPEGSRRICKYRQRIRDQALCPNLINWDVTILFDDCFFDNGDYNY